ncbi:MAG: polysaccharide biosynthesis protein [Clostridia bacterium]|nr:polysaccharide biosynthesis protein [Clostridia bacterium]
MDRKVKSFVSGAAILAVAGLIVKLIGMFFRVGLANLIDTEGMAYYETVYPYYSWLLVISSSGLPTAISKMVSERVTLGDERGAKQVFKNALILLAIIGVITTVIMLFGANLFSSLALPDANIIEIEKQRMSFVAMAPSLLFVSVMCAYRGYLQGRQMMVGTAVSQVVEQVVKLIAGYSLAIAFSPKGLEYAAMGAIIGVTISELAALISVWIIYNRNKRKFVATIEPVRKHPRMTFKRVVKRLAIMAIPITIGASIMPLTGIIDTNAIVNILCDTGYSLEEARTMYSIFRGNITPIINMPAVLTMALAMSLVPNISASAINGEKKRVKKASRVGIKLSMLIGMPCAVGLFVLARPILSLIFGNLSPQELDIAEPLMQISAIGVIFLSLVQTTTGIIQGLGKPRIPVFFLAIGAVVKVVSIIAFMSIKSVNIAGAAISTTLCYAVAGVLDTIYIFHTTNMKPRILATFIKPLICSAFMGLAAWGAYSALILLGSNTIATLGAVMVGVIVYAVMCVVLHVFDNNDMEFIPVLKKIQRITGKRR